MLNNFKTMPSILKLLTVHGLLSSIFIFWAVVPGQKYVNNDLIDYSEFWALGYGFYVLVICIPVVVASIMFLLRNSDGRYIYMLSWLAAPFVTRLMGAEWSTEKGTFIFSVTLAILIYAYLFHKRSVRQYFYAL